MYDRSIREYKHYSAVYGANTAIFLLVGSFYELYDYQDPLTGDTHTSMRRAVEILGIQCKVKKGEGAAGTDALFAGFPDSQLHKFAALLTRENWTVVVIDQIKNGAGKVTSREVARILSPATHVEAAGALDAFYLGGLWLQPPAWGTGGSTVDAPSFAAAALDLTTGGLHTFEGVGTGRAGLWSADDLLHFFQVHPPKELIIWWRGQALDAPEEGFLRRTLGIGSALFHLKTVGGSPDALEKPLVREDLLRRVFQPKSLLPLREVLGLSEKPLTERVLCNLLSFVEDHMPSAMEHLHTPVVWNPRSAVFLGNHALTQLNMICHREEDSVLGLFLRTLTPMGRRAMRRRLLYPICDSKELGRRYEEVGWCKDVLERREDAVPNLLRQIQDLAKLHRRIGLATVNAADVLALEMSYSCANRVAEAIEATPLKRDRGLEEESHALLERFLAVFDLEKAKEASEDLFCLTEEAGPRCSALEKELAETHRKMQATYEALVEWLGETKETLRMEPKEASILLSGGKGLMQRAEKRFKEAGSTTPPSFAGTQIHAKKSTSSMEVPSLNALFQKILRLRSELVATIKEELSSVCDALAEDFTATWDALEEWVSRVDCSFTLARVAVERGFTRPELLDGVHAAAGLKAQGLRHPLIEGQQTRTEYVRHSVSLGSEPEEQGWLVYGMNASGKSSLMKSVGIAVLLAQAGSFVPAERFEFSPFKALYTRILNTDDLWAGLSSFATEMTELREILTKADSYSLVLGDEVCSGTESVSATALVGAALGWLTRRGARYMFATHLHGLQALPAITELTGLRVWHLRVRYDAAADRLVYDRTLHPGAGSSLYGLEVAKAMALPLEVLEAAHAIRRELTGTVKESDAAASVWNAEVCRRKCELCGCGIVRDLEVHHIRPREEADTGGHFKDGASMNALRNLIVVCQKCHDRHHAGELEIGPMKQTSDGPVREVQARATIDLKAYEYKGGQQSTAVSRRTNGLSEEQLDTIKGYLLRFPKIAPARLVYDLETQEGIKITVQKLRTIRGTLGGV